MKETFEMIKSTENQEIQGILEMYEMLNDKNKEQVKNYVRALIQLGEGQAASGPASDIQEDITKS